MQFSWIEENDFDLIEREFQNGADVNGFYPLNAPGRKTLLSKAIAVTNVEMVRFLLERGANPNLGTLGGYAPLHSAANFDSVEITKMLIAAGADVNAQCPNGITPLRIAAGREQKEIVDLLLQAGADIDLPEKNGYSPLAALVLNEQDDMVAFLLERGANPFWEKNDKLCPLAVLSLRRKNDLFRLALQQGWDVSTPLKKGDNILKHVAQNADASFVEAVLDVGANIDLQDGEGFTALNSAISVAYWENVLLLLKRGANPNIPTQAGFFPLHAAVLVGRADIVEELLKAGANPNLVQGDKYSTVLFMAVTYRNADMVRLLLQHGADANAVSWGVKHALTQAVLQDDVAIVRSLLESGANPNELNCLGTGVFKANGEIIDMLLATDWDVSLNVGKAVPPFFSIVTRSELWPVLGKRPIRWRACSEGGTTLLHWAAIHNHVPLMRMIVHQGLFPADVADNFGEPPLQRAVKAKNLEAVQTLVELGADVNHKRQDGITALWLACRIDAVDLARVLLEAGANPYEVKNGCSTILLKVINNKNAQLLALLIPYMKQNGELWEKESKRALSFILRDNQPELFAALSEGQHIDTFRIAEKNTLERCVHWENPLFVQRALSWGANPDVITADGRPLRDVALERGLIKIVELLDAASTARRQGRQSRPIQPTLVVPGGVNNRLINRQIKDRFNGNERNK